MINVDSLTIQYPQYTIFDNLSFAVPQGHTYALVGKSGCGKSTLLSVLAGLYSTKKKASIYIEGTIRINNTQYTYHPTQGLISSINSPPDSAVSTTAPYTSIHYMQQNDLLLPWLNILDNVALPLRINKTSKKEARAHAISFLNQFQMQHTRNLYPAQLSGGMRRRIALLRTCINASTNSILLLDEPFTNLDTITRIQCRDWAKHIIQSTHATTIIVTHDIEEALYFSDMLLILREKNNSHITQIVHTTSSDISNTTIHEHIKNLMDYL